MKYMVPEASAKKSEFQTDISKVPSTIYPKRWQQQATNRQLKAVIPAELPSTTPRQIKMTARAVYTIASFIIAAFSAPFAL